MDITNQIYIFGYNEPNIYIWILRTKYIYLDITNQIYIWKLRTKYIFGNYEQNISIWILTNQIYIFGNYEPNISIWILTNQIYIYFLSVYKPITFQKNDESIDVLIIQKSKLKF